MTAANTINPAALNLVLLLLVVALLNVTYLGHVNQVLAHKFGIAKSNFIHRILRGCEVYVCTDCSFSFDVNINDTAALDMI